MSSVQTRTELMNGLGTIVDKMMLDAQQYVNERVESLDEDKQPNTVWLEEVMRTIWQHHEEMMAFIWD